MALRDDVIKWKHFPRYWPFVQGIRWSPLNFPHKGQWRGALMFSLFCARLNGWANNREAGDMRRYRAHDDVIVMGTGYVWLISPWTKWPPFWQRTFSLHFLEWKWQNSDSNFTEIFSKGSNWQQASIGSGNGLAPSRRQTITWTNHDPVRWRIYVALGGG